MQLPLRTARTFWLKKIAKWLAVRPAPAPAGVPLLVSRFLPTREQTKYHHNPASHHECKNTCHRDAAATCTYRRTLGIINRQPIKMNIIKHILKDWFLILKIRNRFNPSIQIQQRRLFHYYQYLAQSDKVPNLIDTGFRVFSG